MRNDESGKNRITAAFAREAFHFRDVRTHRSNNKRKCVRFCEKFISPIAGVDGECDALIFSYNLLSIEFDYAFIAINRKRNVILNRVGKNCFEDFEN